jgi:hypothetical protein
VKNNARERNGKENVEWIADMRKKTKAESPCGYGFREEEGDVTVTFRWGLESIECNGPGDITVKCMQETEWLGGEETLAWAEDGTSSPVDNPIAQVLGGTEGAIWIGMPDSVTTRGHSVTT